MGPVAHRARDVYGRNIAGATLIFTRGHIEIGSSIWRVWWLDGRGVLSRKSARGVEGSGFVTYALSYLGTGVLLQQ